MTSIPGATRLKPALGLPGLVLFGITYVGPTAPFPMFGIVSTISRGHMALAYSIAMFAMVLTALSYGRMSSVYPAAGSAYSYSRQTLHPIAGFLVGWTMLLDYLLLPLMSVIYVSLIFSRLLPMVPYGAWLLVFASLMTAANLFGLKVTNRANFVMTAVMSAAVLWFVAAAVRTSRYADSWDVEFSTEDKVRVTAQLFVPHGAAGNRKPDRFSGVLRGHAKSFRSVWEALSASESGRAERSAEALRKQRPESVSNWEATANRVMRAGCSVLCQPIQPAKPDGRRR